MGLPTDGLGPGRAVGRTRNGNAEDRTINCALRLSTDLKAIKAEDREVKSFDLWQ
jgi:hypothetical protein